jgi:hypothetical protein
MRWAWLVLHRAAGAASLAALAALWAVDIRSWQRTRSVRYGTPSIGSVSPPATAGASRTTFLAGVAGLAIIAFGLTGRTQAATVRFFIIAAGTLVAVTGLIGRVRMVVAGSSGLLIHYAGRPPALLPWDHCRELRPPSTPLGAWRLVADGRSRSLMPSDLLDHEWVLLEVIERADLAFDGRRWTRGPPRERRRRVSRG